MKYDPGHLRPKKPEILRSQATTGHSQDQEEVGGIELMPSDLVNLLVGFQVGILLVWYLRSLTHSTTSGQNLAT